MGAPFANPKKISALNTLDSAERMILSARLMERIQRIDGCWSWMGYRRGGYGQMRAAGASQEAHRVAYLVWVGPLIEGMEIDHLCRHHSCINPEHLEQVPKKVNTLRGFGSPAQNARKTHCANGHEFTPENTGYRGPGWRYCRACHRADYQKAKRKHAH